MYKVRRFYWKRDDGETSPLYLTYLNAEVKAVIDCHRHYGDSLRDCVVGRSWEKHYNILVKEV